MNSLIGTSSLRPAFSYCALKDIYSISFWTIRPLQHRTAQPLQDSGIRSLTVPPPCTSSPPPQQNRLHDPKISLALLNQHKRHTRRIQRVPDRTTRVRDVPTYDEGKSIAAHNADPVRLSRVLGLESRVFEKQKHANRVEY